MNGPPHLYRCVVRDIVFEGSDGRRLKDPYAVAYSATDPPEFQGSVTFSLQEFRRQNSGAKVHSKAMVMCSVFQRQIKSQDDPEKVGWSADTVLLVTPEVADSDAAETNQKSRRRKGPLLRIVRLPFELS